MPKSSLLMFSAGLLVVGSVNAQWTDARDPAVDCPPGIMLTDGRFNAALQYYPAWMLLEPALEFAEFTPEELDAMDRGELPEAYAHVLESSQEQIADLIEATRLTRCDFGSQYEKGIGVLLPQLGVMRNSAKLLVNDARRLRGSDMDAVAQRLAATIRLGEHASQSHTIIGSLVGVAIAELARVETQKLLDADALSAAQARVIDEALGRVLTEDPFHSLDSIRTERTMMTAWIKNEFTGEHAGRDLAKLLQFENDAAAPEHRKLGRMNGEQVALLTDETSRVYDELIEAWQAEDSIGEMRKIEVKLEEGQYGLVTKLLLPALGSYRKKTIEAEQNLQKLRENLRAVPEG